jgi:hypothetical protein
MSFFKLQSDNQAILPLTKEYDDCDFDSSSELSSYSGTLRQKVMDIYKMISTMKPEETFCWTKSLIEECLPILSMDTSASTLETSIRFEVRVLFLETVVQIIQTVSSQNAFNGQALNAQITPALLTSGSDLMKRLLAAELKTSNDIVVQIQALSCLGFFVSFEPAIVPSLLKKVEIFLLTIAFFICLSE